MASTTIGEQLKRLRRQRGLTQAQLAERAGVSEVLVSKLERDERQTARLTSLRRLARALKVPLSALVAQGARPGQSSVATLREVLLTPSALPGIDHADDSGEAPPLSELRAAVDAGWGHYWSGRFGLLAQTLPAAIGEARLARQVAGPSSAGLLAQAYQLAGILAVHLGAEDLAGIGAERGVVAASEGDDELQWAHLSGTYAWVLLAQGRLEESERLAARTAEKIEPARLSAASAAHLTTWGSLLLTAQAPAAGLGRAKEVNEYLSLAGAAAAARREEGWFYQTNCGPTSVAMQTTYACITLEQPGRALKAAEDVRREDLLPISWSRFLLDVAQSHLLLRRHSRAVETLQSAYANAPEWFAYQPPARQMVAELAERHRRLPPTLRALAQAVEMDENSYTLY